MADDAEIPWGADEEAPARRRGLPRWVLYGCGIGCLVGLIALGGLGWLTYRIAKEASDPEIVWSKIDALLPYDERPAGWQAHGVSFSMFGYGQFMLEPRDEPFALLVLRLPNARELSKMLDPDTRANQGVFGIGEIQDAEPGTLTVQGRETRCLRFRAWAPKSLKEKGFQGASVRVDLSGDGAEPVLVQIIGEGDVGRVEGADVERLLAPFHVWEGR